MFNMSTEDKLENVSPTFGNTVLPAVVGSKTKYQIVYADPAWDFGDRLRSSKKLDNGKMHFRELNLHYKTMKTIFFLMKMLLGGGISKLSPNVLRLAVRAGFKAQTFN